MHTDAELEAAFLADLVERMHQLQPVLATAHAALIEHRDQILVSLGEADPRALASARPSLPWPYPPRFVQRLARIDALRDFLTRATSDAAIVGLGDWALVLVDEMDADEDAPHLSAALEQEWRRAVALLVDLAALVSIHAAELAWLLAIERGLRALDHEDHAGRPTFLRYYDVDDGAAAETPGV